MAIPLIPAALAGLAKLGIGAKLAGAFGAAKGLVGGAAARQLAIPGLQMAAKEMAPRMAGDAMFKSGVGKAIFGQMGKADIIGRLAPDAMFGGMAALQTPGDIGDKLIAGTTSVLGGGLGGIALSRGASRLGMRGMSNYMADMAGSVGGDMVGMAVGDGLMKGKDKIAGGTGQTPYERMSAEQQAQFAEQIRRQTLAGAGLVPGVRDQFMYENGLA